MEGLEGFWPAGAYYLDFETVSPAIPLYPGTSPFQTIPFQWSLHRVNRNGKTTHREFPADGGTDPRRELAENLISAVGKRRVVAKVEWHPGELCPRVGFIVTNLSRPAEWVVAFYNQRGKAEQFIMEGKNAIKWTRLSCRKFRDNAVRLQLHALAYNRANFMRTLALPKEVEHWSLTTLREKLVKIDASNSPISVTERYVVNSIPRPWSLRYLWIHITILA